MASQEVGHSTWFRSCIPIISVQVQGVQPLGVEAGEHLVHHDEQVDVLAAVVEKGLGVVRLLVG
ncbi:hypothetical protein CIP107554_00692 [Corynebacterium diphtheriae]|nr:hypothetical protein CIP107554_00692 [Corynebacterium diphtheriae]